MAKLTFSDNAHRLLVQMIADVVQHNRGHFSSSVLSHTAALNRFKSRGGIVGSIIDVGASDGRWSLMARRLWPEARCHLIEAFEQWRAKLESLTQSEPLFTFTLAAAGPSDGETYFHNDADQPLGGVASDSPFKNSWKVRQVAIDAEVERHGLTPPFLVKLDTHGFERPILEGARETLERASILVIEVYNFMETSKRFPALCQHLETLGFRCADIGEPMWRPSDGALWQIDMFFEPIGSKTFASEKYA